jgi:hypothetical protein
MKIECGREPDVLDALAAQRWPARCDDDLRAHVSTCLICGDLVEVAGALLEDHDTAHQDARVPPSGIVWWRAQLRARDEDARAAARPIAFIQGVAVSVAVWVVVTLLRAVPASTVAAWKEWIIGFVPHVSVPVPGITEVTAAIPVNVLLVVGAALLLAPLAIYFAVAED